MLITVVGQNIQHGGFTDKDGKWEDRWPLLRERLAAAEPDVLVLNETRGWTTGDHWRVGRAMRDLDMYAVPPPPRTVEDNGSLILARWDTMGPLRYTNHDFSGHTVNGFTTVSFDVEGLEQPITFVGLHLTPYSATAALAEAELVVTRGYQNGSLVVALGDVNFAPADGPEPDYSKMRVYNKASRTLPSENGTGLRPNRDIAKAIERRGFIDVALHLARKTGDESLLEHTASDDRIDLTLVSEPMADAVKEYARLGTPARASDHDGTRTVIDTDDIDRSKMFDYQ
ncbi:endonuclease/exonuclease/phosphatase family protein [Micromonospora sp. WMMD1082]|uniref:endonuclease/exonuclease/phosphatase family protein n=1 Tax=Micromonospora sp. WMMD1082 TaxID=3016104 RepID=UPI00241809C2|nr:endonuclease/exonuclease/phosphatase family protein [Micromonospora sp. WMMD1082]MDG4795193.1 hypothetical protein [Micromonospora sp. WMMD1082]